MVVASRFKIMAILNLTPDSFSDGQPQATSHEFFLKAKKLIDDGADILDIGGESTRPGSVPVTIDEEKRRVISFLKIFREHFPDFPVSLDTKKYEVALAAMPYGISYLNDVSFLEDIRLAKLAKHAGINYILMHTRGNHDNMLKQTTYEQGLFPTLQHEVENKFKILNDMDFDFSKLILDPGFGFAKTPEQCMAMMENLEFWQQFGVKLLIGVSRKRFLQKYLGECEPVSRDALSAEFACQAFLKGFYMARVHDVVMTRKNLESVLGVV